MKNILRVVLSGFGESALAAPVAGDRCMEFHVHASVRRSLGLQEPLFRTTGNLIIPDFDAARSFAARVRASGLGASAGMGDLSAGRLYAMGLIDETLHIVFRLYREQRAPRALSEADASMAERLGGADARGVLRGFTERFPPSVVYSGAAEAETWLDSDTALVSNRELSIEELILLKLANENPAFAPYRFLFDDGIREDASEPGSLAGDTRYQEGFASLEQAFRGMPGFGPGGGSLIDLLREPARACPDSLEGQLRWIIEHWGASFTQIGERLRSLLGGLDLIAEEERPQFPPGPGPARAPDYRSLRHEYEKFSPDRDWMPRAIMIAKSVLVWLHQLSVTYGRPISRLDEIPDDELAILAHRGINALWLIGLWERSAASERIKRYCGNPEAAASAYSLHDYEISRELGGWEALDRLRDRCGRFGIKLAADMVPNHTGIDSEWVRHRPGLFMGSDHCPFPTYSFNGPDLSGDPEVGIWLEDHYYSRSDAAVVFKRLDRKTGQVRYLYHGNDGTGMAWNDTAQIDFLNPEAREAVKERILHVARHFGIIRFDAAMVLAKQHIRRLWYPAPGSGGAIPSRAAHALDDAAFDRAIPQEFWREVVDLCAREAPDTLLLAEAFWMMEGYFVRTLGMHRVYNSAFMNMLKEEKNSLYRLTIRNTQEFDREILKRYVNFMNNPDEETANAQFGSGDKYFGVFTMMLCMPGLPMIGHGQIENFTEKYGMEYRRAYKDERPDVAFIARHEREIFPLARMRWLFSGVEHFHLYDFIRDEGRVDENVFAWSNGSGDARALLFFNNAWERTSGRITHSCPWAEKNPDGSRRLASRSLVEALDVNASPGSYLIAREQRSGLRFVMRATDLRDRGWHVRLDGYQTLAFIEFDRVSDPDGRYERLCAALDGSGTADFDSALEEASRPDLYRAMSGALRALLDCAAPLASGDTETYGARAADAAEASELLFGRIALALAEEQGPGPSIGDAAGARRALEACMAAMGDSSRSEGSAWGAHSTRISAAGIAYAFVLALGDLRYLGNPSEELRFVIAKFLVQAKLATALSAVPEGGLAPADAPVLAVDGPAWASIIVNFAARPRRTSEPDARDRAIELLRWAISDQGARDSIGMNEWQGRKYFNRERMEALLAGAPVFCRLEALAGGRTAAEADEAGKAAQAVVDILRSAIPAAEYDIELLAETVETVQIGGADPEAAAAAVVDASAAADARGAARAGARR